MFKSSILLFFNLILMCYGDHDEVSEAQSVFQTAVVDCGSKGMALTPPDREMILEHLKSHNLTDMEVWVPSSRKLIENQCLVRKYLLVERDQIDFTQHIETCDRSHHYFCAEKPRGKSLLRVIGKKRRIPQSINPYAPGIGGEGVIGGGEIAIGSQEAPNKYKTEKTGGTDDNAEKEKEKEGKADQGGTANETTVNPPEQTTVVSADEANTSTEEGEITESLPPETEYQISGIRVATMFFALFNMIWFTLCVVSSRCVDWQDTIQQSLHMFRSVSLVICELCLLLSAAIGGESCSSVIGAALQFSVTVVLVLTTLDGIHLIHASFSEELPRVTSLYIAATVIVPVALTSIGLKVFQASYIRFEQMCSLDLSGGGWLTVGPVITLLSVNTIALIVFVLRLRALPAYSHQRPVHFKNYKKTLLCLMIPTYTIGLQWLFGVLIQSGGMGMSVMFLLFQILTPPIYALGTFVPREVRSGVARKCGQRGKTLRSFADFIRPRPHKVDGQGPTASYHAPPRVTGTLKNTLDRGIRPSIHLIEPLDHVPAGRTEERQI